MLKKHFRIYKKVPTWTTHSGTINFQNPSGDSNGFPDWFVAVWAQSNSSKRQFVRRFFKYTFEKGCMEPAKYLKNNPIQTLVLYAGVSGALSQANNLALTHLNNKNKDHDLLLRSVTKNLAPQNPIEAHNLLEETILLSNRQKELNEAYWAFSHPSKLMAFLEAIFLVPIKHATDNPYLSLPSELSHRTLALMERNCADHVKLSDYNLPEMKEKLFSLKDYTNQPNALQKIIWALSLLKGEWVILGLVVTGGYTIVKAQTGGNRVTRVPLAWIDSRVISLYFKKLGVSFYRILIDLNILKAHVFFLEWPILQLIRTIFVSYILFLLLFALFLFCLESVIFFLPQSFQLHLLTSWEKLTQFFDWFFMNLCLNLLLFPFSFVTLSIKGTIVIKNTVFEISGNKSFIIAKKIEEQISNKNPFFKCLSYLSFLYPLDGIHFHEI